MSKVRRSRREINDSASTRGATPSSAMALDSATGQAYQERILMLETMLGATTRSLELYRSRVERLMEDNENVQAQLQTQESDTLEMVTLMKQESESRDTQIKDLQVQLIEAKAEAERDKSALIDQYTKQIEEMQANISEKESNMKLIQQELHVIKDFRKKRQSLLKELEDKKNEVLDLEQRHRDTMQKMEKKFLEEKIRLQKEANRKISELATKAHKEAIANLTETQRTVFRENMRMSEALRYHIQEGEGLLKQNSQLTDHNRTLTDEKKLHDEIVRQKIMQTRNQSLHIKELEKKIHTLEHSLSYVIREFEHEREIIGRMAKAELDEIRGVATQLKQQLHQKTREIKYIRRMAQYILDNRSDLERFFVEALETVRDEQRRQQLLQRRRGGGALPSKSVYGASTMTVTSATTSAAPVPSAAPANVDISDLSWRDKERVLRLLFAQMNGVMIDKPYQRTQQNGEDLLFVDAPQSPSQEQQQQQQAEEWMRYSPMTEMSSPDASRPPSSAAVLTDADLTPMRSVPEVISTENRKTEIVAQLAQVAPLSLQTQLEKEKTPATDDSISGFNNAPSLPNYTTTTTINNTTTLRSSTAKLEPEQNRIAVVIPSVESATTTTTTTETAITSTAPPQDQ